MLLLLGGARVVEEVALGAALELWKKEAERTQREC